MTHKSIREVDSLEELDHYAREKFERGESMYEGETISYTITNDKQIDDAFAYAEKKDDRNLKCILTELREHRGEHVELLGGRSGIFLGIEATHEDYYYIVMQDDGKKICSSCVGSLKFI